jgi:hypothetical protein
MVCSQNKKAGDECFISQMIFSHMISVLRRFPGSGNPFLVVMTIGFCEIRFAGAGSEILRRTSSG